MVFPGIGRQAWVSGSLGGGTGRSTDWNTYDGTEDTAWQVMVDETSTSLGSSYTLSKTEKNHIRAGVTKSYLAITDGTNEYLGVTTADTADATSMQIDLIGPFAMDRPEINILDNIIMMSSLEDDGSFIFFKDAGGITHTGKMSGYMTWTGKPSSNERHGSVFFRSHMPDYNIGSAPGYAYNTQAPKGYVIGIVGRKTNAISSGSRNGVPGDGYIDAPMANIYGVRTMDTVFSTPSTGLTSLINNGDVETENTSQLYLPLVRWHPNYPNVVDGNDTLETGNTDAYICRPLPTGDDNETPNRFSQFSGHEYNGGTTVLLNFRQFTSTDGSTLGTNSPAQIWDIDSRTYHMNNPGSGWRWSNFNDPTYYITQDPVSGGANDVIIPTVNGDRVIFRDGDSRTKTQMGQDLTQAIRLGEAQTWIGMYPDCSGSVGGNLYLTAVARTQENVKTNAKTARQMEYIVCDDISTPDTHASNSIAVSVINGSDSTSTAFDVDDAVLFNLQGNYFAVLWHKLGELYISIFKSNAQTSAMVDIDRVVDAQSLGTVPADSGSAKTLSGCILGSGVALITCGNYYKFIKVPK